MSSPSKALAAAHETITAIMADVAPEHRDRAARLLARAACVSLAHTIGPVPASEAVYRLADEIATL